MSLKTNMSNNSQNVTKNMVKRGREEMYKHRQDQTMIMTRYNASLWNTYGPEI